jgi:Holliday junction resolvase RusA-like endonuclease
MAVNKSRKQKSVEYENKYKDIPIDYRERLLWMYNKFNINQKKEMEILNKRNEMLMSLYYTDICILLFEEPEGSPRPRFRLINRKNFMNEAIANSSFVHVYSISGAQDNIFMKRLLNEDLIQLQHMIYTPCVVEFNTYSKTPSVYNAIDTYLAEIGLIRPITKPDWDNIGKKYSDMFNHNVWFDDTLVISGTVNKFYSVLPRIEIKIKYLNMVYNKHQFNSMAGKVEGDYELQYFGGNRK